MEADGLLYRVQRQRYAVPERINLAVGRLQTTRGGAGFLIPDDRSGDVFIAPRSLNTAVNGDRVVVRVESGQRGDRPEGRVVRVLERARQTVVGVFHGARGGRGRKAAHGFVVPEDRRLPWDIHVGPGGAGEAEEGDLVVVRITDWGSDHRGPTGEIEDVLGRPGDTGVGVLAIIRAHELPTDFPADVERAAAAAGTRGIRPEDLAGRDDLRDALIFTIDPADARDHDDALSIERLAHGWRGGVHNAVLSRYGGDSEPLGVVSPARGTSGKNVDRGVPKRPHAQYKVL
jgi:ribonuclease R